MTDLHPPVHARIACNSLGLVRLKPGAQKSTQIFCGGVRDPSTVGHLPTVSPMLCIFRDLGGKQRQDSNPCTPR